MTHDMHTTRPIPMSCEQFEQRLGDFLEGDLDAATHMTMDQHRAGCDACAALTAELSAIVQEAAALPVLQPTRDLWAGISARIEAPVLPLAPATVKERVARGHRAWTGRRWIGAAAAALLVVSVGAVGLRQLDQAGQPAATTTVATVAPTSPTTSGAAVPGGPSAEHVGAPVPAGSTMATDRPIASGPTAPAVTGAPLAGGTTRLALATNAPAVSAGETVLDGELGRMRRLLAERRQTLDTATVRVLENNIAIIDHAIAESRAALARDPASDLLNRQLSDALGDKLELMRTAVMLTRGD